jgi:DNA-binding transcriptional LysR family regulator
VIAEGIKHKLQLLASALSQRDSSVAVRIDSMLDLRRLRVLRVVAEHGSLRAAAEAMSYSRAAISQQVSALEREVGAPVLERHARGVRLTDVGRMLVSHTDAIVARLSEAEAEVEAIADLRAGRVRLGSFPSAAAALLPEALQLMGARYPGVELTLVSGESDELITALKRRDIDCGVIFHAADDKRREAGIALHPLIEDPLLVALPAEHRLAARGRLRLAELRDERWIQGSHGYCLAILRRACWGAGFEPYIAYECDAFDASLLLVRAGLGVALVPRMVVRDPVPGVAWRDVGADTPSRRVFAAVLSAGFTSPGTKAMLEVLEETAAAYAARTMPLSSAA